MASRIDVITKHTIPSKDPRPQQADVLSCVHCHRDLVVIYHTTTGKREFVVSPGVECTVQNAQGPVTCFKCPTCGHSIVVAI